MSEKNYSVLANYARPVVIGSYIALCLLITAGVLVWPSCDRDPSFTIWAVQLLLLLIFLPGLLSQNLRALIWLCFMLLGFFIAAISTAFVCHSLPAQLEVAAITLLFSSTIAYVRWRAKALKQAQ